MTQNKDSAVALKYSSQEQLPEIIARGQGALAEKILKLAQEHDIPIQENSSLLALLDQAPALGSIPQVAFGLVAEVLCFLYEMDEKFKEQHVFMKKITKP